MRKILIASIFITLGLQARSQGAEDALRYTMISPIGSSRYQSMAGSFGALGGDPSGIHLNPGTLGAFRSNHYSFTLGSSSTSTNSKLLNNVSPEQKSIGVALGNISAVWSSPIVDSDWKYFSFGMSHTRQQDYRKEIEFEGLTPGSNIESFLAPDGFYTPDTLRMYFPFDYGVAYDAGVTELNPSDTTNRSYRAAEFSPNSNHRTKVNSRGGLSETAISLGGNLKNQWFYGVTIGIPRVRYESNTTFSEASTDSSTTLQHYEYQTKTDVVGSGFNFKVGFVYKANDNIRLGMAFHSPTFFTFTEEYETRMTSNLGSSESPLALFEYFLNTPSRFTGSFGYIMGKSGVISFDYLTYNPAGAKFRTTQYLDDGTYDFANSDIKTTFQRIHNFRVGAEYRVSYLSFRGGFGYQTDAIKPEYSTHRTAQTYVSGGLGLRNGNYYLDLGFSTISENYDYYYSASSSDAASVAENKTNIQVTLGYRFK